MAIGIGIQHAVSECSKRPTWGGFPPSQDDRKRSFAVIAVPVELNPAEAGRVEKAQSPRCTDCQERTSDSGICRRPARCAHVPDRCASRLPVSCETNVLYYSGSHAHPLQIGMVRAAQMVGPASAARLDDVCTIHKDNHGSQLHAGRGTPLAYPYRADGRAAPQCSPSLRRKLAVAIALLGIEYRSNAPKALVQ
jgi:hypothetical protein